MKSLKCFLLCAVAAVMLTGCGTASNTREAAGRLSLTVIWPKRTRLIPLASGSIRAVLTRGQQTVGSQLIPGGDGPPANPTTVTFDNLPAGPVTLTTSAYPGQDGSGVAQATGAQSVSIVSGQTAQVTVTMASTIDHVAITPVNPSITVGPFLLLTMTAFDAAGNIVLASLTANFVSADTGIVRVVTGGNPSTVQGFAVGSSLVTVTERESGKTASTTVTVTGSTPSANTGPIGSTIDPTGRFVYIADQRSSTISQVRIGADGTLAPLSPPTVSVVLPPYFILADPKPGSHAVYVSATDNTSGTIYQFNINTDGTLSPLAPASAPSGVQPVSLAIDAGGRFLYAADHGEGKIYPYRINADGALTSLGIGPTGAAFSIAITPDGKFVYGGYQLTENRVNPDGTLTNIGTIPTAAVQEDIAVDGSGKFLYTVEGAVAGTQGHIVPYKINPDGSLTANGPPVPFGTTTYKLLLHPNGRFLYATSIFMPDNQVGQFRINEDGTITPLSPATVPTGGLPFSGSVSPDGKYVYFTSQRDNTVSQFRVNADGTLTPLSPPSTPG